GDRHHHFHARLAQGEVTTQFGWVRPAGRHRRLLVRSPREASLREQPTNFWARAGVFSDPALESQPDPVLFFTMSPWPLAGVGDRWINYSWSDPVERVPASRPQEDGHVSHCALPAVVLVSGIGPAGGRTGSPSRESSCGSYSGQRRRAARRGRHGKAR